MNREVLKHFALDPAVTFLNHGSFGACPLVVLEHQRELRMRMEREPVQFLARDLERNLDDARARVAAFVGADASRLAFVPNATAAVNAVLQSLAAGAGARENDGAGDAAAGASSSEQAIIRAGDEIVTTDHDYNACRNVLERFAARVGATVVVAHLPMPLTNAGVVDAVLGALTEKTRLVLVDHVTSPTAAVLPVGAIVRACEDQGVRVLVDGAHAPGMLDLDVTAIGASYYTGNCHKWMCAPKGAGFLSVREDRVDEVRPAITSHGKNSTRVDRSRFLLEFDWVGTVDPTAFLSVPVAIDAMASIFPGGWPAIRAHNRALAIEAGHILQASSPTVTRVLTCDDAMVGSMRALTIEDMSAVELEEAARAPIVRAFFTDPMQQRLFDDHKIEVPISAWPHSPKRVLRVSAQIYNDVDDYRALAVALSRA